MPNVLRKTPPEHKVVVDTNVLWHEDKSFVVSPEFERFWKTYGTEFKLELVIPDIVRGELLYQQTTSALKALAKANDLFSKVSAIAEREYSHRVSEHRVKKDVAERLGRWIATAGAVVVQTPIEKIEWAKLIERAVWREPPFAADPNNPEQEKGFRDALILECLREVCSSSETDVAMISSDRLLLEAIAAELKDRCATYETTDDFVSYVRLTKEDLTQAFVRAIQQRARKRFWDLWRRDGIGQRILLEQTENLKPPPEGVLGLLGVPFGQDQEWVPTTRHWFYVTRPRFEKLEGERDFHWANVVTFVRGYERPGGRLPLLVDNRRILVSEFRVAWTAEVRRDGRFYNLEVAEIAHIERKFERPEAEDLEMYDIFATAKDEEDVD